MALYHSTIITVYTMPMSEKICSFPCSPSSPHTKKREPEGSLSRVKRYISSIQRSHIFSSSERAGFFPSRSSLSLAFLPAYPESWANTQPTTTIPIKSMIASVLIVLFSLRYEKIYLLTLTIWNKKTFSIEEGRENISGWVSFNLPGKRQFCDRSKTFPLKFHKETKLEAAAFSRAMWYIFNVSQLGKCHLHPTFLFISIHSFLKYL